MKNKIKISMIIMFIMMMTSITVSAATFINSKDVIYDNSISGLKSTNVQSAVDELYSAATDYSSLNQRILTLENDTKNVINKIYPVGSVYISTTDDTIEKVKGRFGGDWERYAEGRTLIGVGTSTDKDGNVSTYTANQVGGLSKLYVGLTNLPSRIIVEGGPSVDKKNSYSGYGDYSNHKFVSTSLEKYYKAEYNTDYKNTSLDNTQPYITTYMYKRVK